MGVLAVDTVSAPPLLPEPSDRMPPPVRNPPTPAAVPVAAVLWPKVPPETARPRAGEEGRLALEEGRLALDERRPSVTATAPFDVLAQLLLLDAGAPVLAAVLAAAETQAARAGEASEDTRPLAAGEQGRLTLGWLLSRPLASARVTSAPVRPASPFPGEPAREAELLRV